MARLRRGVSGTLVLDAEGLVKLSSQSQRAWVYLEEAFERNTEIVTAATTLTEVLRGRSQDAPIHRILSRVNVISITKDHAQTAAKLLGQTGLSGHQCALDALLATVALAQPRPVVILTSDVKDMARLTEEPGKPVKERVSIVRI